jgi:hypothetical protein
MSIKSGLGSDKLAQKSIENVYCNLTGQMSPWGASTWSGPKISNGTLSLTNDSLIFKGDNFTFEVHPQKILDISLKKRWNFYLREPYSVVTFKDKGNLPEIALFYIRGLGSSINRGKTRQLYESLKLWHQLQK